MAFRINQKLREDIVSKIPKDYTPLETCVLVYFELCHKLRYSMDYYINEEKFIPYFTNPHNLSKVDGEVQKDVVCYTFNAIYQEIIEGLDLPNTSFDYGVQLDDDGSLLDEHDSLLLYVDGVVYNVDATLGVLENNDLIDLRYFDGTINGFTINYVEDESREDEAQEELDMAIYEVESRDNLPELINLYVAQKQHEYKELPLVDRFNLYKKMIMDAPDYSVLTLNYINKVKRACFDKTEYKVASSQADDHLQYFQHTYVRDAKTNNAKVLIFFNPKGYNKAQKNYNFDSLEVCEFDVKNKTLKNMRIAELYLKIANEAYYVVDGYGNQPVMEDSILVNMIRGYEP